MPSAHASEAAKPADAWQKFRRWRWARPFWGGLLLILSGLEIFLSGNLSLGALQVHVGVTGFLSYVVPAVLLLCGAGVWITPNLRLFYGVVGSLTAVYSLIGVNFGGFLIGLLLGIIGGALAIAWSPVVVATSTSGALPTDEPETVVEETVVQAGSADGAEQVDYPSVPAEVGQHGQTSDRWWDPSQAGPRHGEEEPPSHGAGSGGSHSRLLAITLVPVTLAAALVTVVQAAPPAYAAPCPPTPSASASAARSASPSTSGQVAAPQLGKPNSQTPGPQNGVVPGNAVPGASASPVASPSAEPPKGGSNPLADAWNGLVGGVKKLFGGDTAATPVDPAPSASAAPSPTAAPSPGASPNPSASTPGTQSGRPAVPGLTGAPNPGARASGAPCSIATAAVDPGQPLASLVPGVITGAGQIMKDFKFEGVVDLPTKNGTVRVLKLTMSKAVTTPFQLTVPERSGRTTQIKSSELTIQGDANKVTFYTPKFTGTLTSVTLPIIPITIPPLLLERLKPLTTLTLTPDSPLLQFLPQIAFPEMRYKDVTLDLAFVHSDSLIAKNLHIEAL